LVLLFVVRDTENALEVVCAAEHAIDPAFVVGLVRVPCVAPQLVPVVDEF
jgi:hypothetical protein